MQRKKDDAERAIRDVQAAVTGADSSGEVNPELAKSDEAPIDDRTAHTRTTADAADETARPDPDADTDIGASDDLYKRTRGMRTR